MAMKWITHTGLDDSTILIIMILFIGIAGLTIPIMDMDIHHGTIHFITHRGDGEGTAGIHHIADGDGAFHPIIVTTEVIMAGETHIIMDMVDMVDIMEATITTRTDMSIQGITIMEEGPQVQMHIEALMTQEEAVQLL